MTLLPVPRPLPAAAPARGAGALRPGCRAGAGARGAAGLAARGLAAAVAVAVMVTVAGPAARAAEPAGPARVLRYAFPVAETGFDPAQVADLYSKTVVANIFEAPLAYDPLARPVRLVPQTAAAMPEVSADHTRFVVTLQPGIFFADDPAFGGRPRELTAADYVYAIKRHYDPRWKSPSLFLFENAGLLGLDALRAEALKPGGRFDYDRPVEGLRALDRHRFEIRLARPAPRFLYTLADPSVSGAVAREVVERHGDAVMAHPVGTGPFRLGDWRRSSRIVLTRNPGFRTQHWAAQPAADDAEGQALAARLRGRRLPLLDRVEISIIEEAQPRWLAFLNGELDLLERLPPEFVPLALAGERLAPHLARQGIGLQRAPAVDTTFVYFNMDDPLVGGLAPAQVALRRAIGLAYDVAAEIAQVRQGQAQAAQGLLPPGVSGHDPAWRSEMSTFDPARAQALLDLYGWRDRDGDGWRELPDGRPLVLQFASQSDKTSRLIRELWKKRLDAVGLRVDFRIAQWPENLKASRAGKLMMWGVAWGAATPDGAYFLDLLYGPNAGEANMAHFRLPAFDALQARIAVLPDGPAREQLMREAQRLAVAYLPYKASSHRINTALTRPGLIGYRPHPFASDFWRHVDREPDIPR